MSHFVWTFRVQLLLLSVALVTSNSTSQIHLRRDSNLIASFLQKFIKPFLRTTHQAFNPFKLNTTTKHSHETKIAKLIKKKVIELKPLLEDADDHGKHETEDNLTLRGNEETTVIEFLPKSTNKIKDGTDIMPKKSFNTDPLKNDINKYKLLREQIELALDEESISKETKSLILNTLDEMLAKLIESQCTWNPSSHSIDRRLLKAHNDTHESIAKLHGMSKKQWKQLRHQYLAYLNHKRDKENAFMNEFHQFFSSVINDTYNLSDRYKIKCQLVEMQDVGRQGDKSLLRGHHNSDSNDQCGHFRVCSEELRDFLMDFYTYVNDTAVSTFRDYAEMYDRDVNVDFGIDKKVVITVINTLGNNAEKKVSKILKKAIKKFTLDPNKLKQENIIRITTFIKNVVMYVKTAVKENLVQELSAMKTKLFLTVKEDLLVNLEIDMENLEKHYTQGLCSMFLSCNGRFYSRRQAGPWTFRPRANSEVFVKVQLSLDDEMKDAVAQSGLLQVFDSSDHLKYRFNRVHENKIDVTRTTVNTSVTTAVQLNYENTYTKHTHHKKKTHTSKSDSLRNMTNNGSDQMEENEIL